MTILDGHVVDWQGVLDGTVEELRGGLNYTCWVMRKDVTTVVNTLSDRAIVPPPVTIPTWRLHGIVVAWRRAFKEFRANNPYEYKRHTIYSRLEALSTKTNFPREWSRERALKEIYEAYENKVQVGPSTYEGRSKGGMDIILVHADGDIVTAYPRRDS